jgi:lysophospholipase-2
MSNTHITTRSSDGGGEETIVLTPRNESAQSACIIICHGLGDTADGWIDTAGHMASSLPYIKFILPTAPRRRVTMNMGMVMPAWYDITGLDKRSNEQCDGIDASRARLVKLMEDEMTMTGLPRSRILLAGFSQGGALSLYTGMQLSPSSTGAAGDGNINTPLAGIVIMSGYLPHSSGFTITPGLEHTPIFHGHGESDPLIKVEYARESCNLVTNNGGGKGGGATNYQLVTYPNLAHSISPKEISDVLLFIQKVLPPNDNYKIQMKDPMEMSVKELKSEIAKAGLGRLALGFSEKGEFITLLKNHRNGKL